MAVVRDDSVTIPPTATPDAALPITADLARDLVDSQFPQWRDEPLTFASEGWDNVMYRLGQSLAVRLPRRELTARFAAAEHTWLPRISGAWTFSAPVPVVIGAPSPHYPWEWSVVPWIEGTVAIEEPLTADGAADLGAALAQIHVPAPADAPFNTWRSIPLAARTERFLARLEMLSSQPAWGLDTEAALAVFAAAGARGDLTWCHLDLHGRNILTNRGRLAGILDWGDAAAGDPCADLGQALYLLGGTLYEDCAAAYVGANGAGDPTAPRVRAEAIAYAVTMASLEDQVYAASGWRALEDLGLATPNG